MSHFSPVASKPESRLPRRRWKGFRRAARTAAASIALMMLAATFVQQGAAAETAAEPVNAALKSSGAVVSASGSEGDGSFGWTPEKVIDGITSGPAGTNTSRWSSNAADDAWITVKTAEPVVIDHVNIYWETACAKRYVLQVSTDGQNWVDATGEVAPACAQLDTQTVGGEADPLTAYQYVRMQTLERTPIGGRLYGVSLWELEIWTGPEPKPEEEAALIPQPAVVENDDDAAPFVLEPSLTINTTGDATPVAELLAQGLRDSTGYDVPVQAGGEAAGSITITVDPDAAYTVDGAAASEESYVLDVTTDGVSITAKTPHGAFNATQTLRQLLPAWAHSDTIVNTEWAVPAIHVEDAPRFSYRAVMLDVARSFQSVDAVKKYIDTLSQLKMSVLHFHLSDDQGWRIQITNEGKVEGDPIDYSRLTSVSGSTGMNTRGYQDELGRTGFYTQDEFRDIVAYAKERFVTIVPEIDVPGHTNAALYAIPELNTERSLPARDPKTGVVPWNGTGNVGYSALDEQLDLSYTFVQHVFKQVAEMADSPYVHIGGDESHAMGHTRYVDFIKKVVPKVREVTGGAGTIGWSEYAEAGLEQGPGYWNGSVVHYWVGAGSWVRDFVAKGGKAVVSAAGGAYIDQKYTPATPIGLSWACSGTCDVDRYYNWEPTTVVPGGVPESGLLGVAAPLWSETVRGLDQAQYLTLPRAAAVLETGWSAADRKDVESFKDRLGQFGEHLTVQGANYYETPTTKWTTDVAGLDLDARTNAQAKWPVGQVVAPGTKSSADGTSIVADTVTTDGDTVSNSALTEPLTGELVCGTTIIPVNFTQDQERDNLHSAGVYSAVADHAFAADASCTLTLSTGETRSVNVAVAPDNPLPPIEPGPTGDPAVTAGHTDKAAVAGNWEPLSLTGFAPNDYVDISVNGERVYSVRTLEDGTFTGHGVVPRETPAGEATLTASQGERTASVSFDVDSDFKVLANPLDQSLLSVHDVDSEETEAEDGAAINVLDGDPATIWHTQWSAAQPAFPHWITLDLGAEYNVTGLQYLARQSGANGRIKDYEIQVSADGTTWSDPVAAGAFTADTFSQTVELESTRGRYVKLSALNSIPGNAFAGAAEINIGGTPVDNAAPVASLAIDPATPASGWHTSAATVTATATDDGDSAPTLEIDAGAGWQPYEGPVEVSTEGVSTVSARATDAAGNVSDVVSLDIRVDTEKPVTSAVVDEDARTVSLGATDAGSGVDRVEYAVGDAAFAEYGEPIVVSDAQTTVRYRAVDVAGNVAEALTVEVPKADDGRAETSVTVTWKDDSLPQFRRAIADVTVNSPAGQPGGVVELLNGDEVIDAQTLKKKGTAQLSFRVMLDEGTHNLTVRYVGDASYAPSETEVELSVEPTKARGRAGR
ncbi:hypothetical protein GCM10027403_08220 [Arthrobacter tecti]